MLDTFSHYCYTPPSPRSFPIQRALFKRSLLHAPHKATLFQYLLFLPRFYSFVKTYRSPILRIREQGKMKRFNFLEFLLRNRSVELNLVYIKVKQTIIRKKYDDQNTIATPRSFIKSMPQYPTPLSTRIAPLNFV